MGWLTIGSENHEGWRALQDSSIGSMSNASREVSSVCTTCARNGKRRTSVVAERQKPLRRTYCDDPERARTVKGRRVRMIAELLGIPILDLQVELTGDVDVRGCLAVERSVRVGFQAIACRVDLRVPSEVDPQRLAMLQKLAEQSCVNLDTLRSGVPVELAFNIVSPSSSARVEQMSAD